jgi:hypothetical protein
LREGECADHREVFGSQRLDPPATAALLVDFRISLRHHDRDLALVELAAGNKTWPYRFFVNVARWQQKSKAPVRQCFLTSTCEKNSIFPELISVLENVSGLKIFQCCSEAGDTPILLDSDVYVADVYVSEINMKAKFEGARMSLHMPPAYKRWIEEQAHKNFTTANAEVLAAIRLRMETEAKSAARDAAGEVA